MARRGADVNMVLSCRNDSRHLSVQRNGTLVGDINTRQVVDKFTVVATDSLGMSNIMNSLRSWNADHCLIVCLIYLYPIFTERMTKVCYLFSSKTTFTRFQCQSNFFDLL